MPSPDAAQVSQKHILWVEDDDDIIEAIVPLLNMLPATVSVVKTGDEAVDFLLDVNRSENPIDLIIMDVWLPRSAAHDLDEKIGMKLLIDMNTQYDLGDSIPIIVFTGRADYDDCIQCIQAGADYYLGKADLTSSQYNVEKLFTRCHSLLYPVTNRPKIATWLDEFLPQLGHLQGRVLSIVAPEIAAEIQIPGTPYGDFFVITASDFEEMRNLILNNQKLRWLVPPIIALG